MDWSILWQYRWSLADGALITAELSILGIAGGTLLGLAVAAAEQLSSPTAHRLVRAYIEVLRNVPSIVKIFVLYYVVGLDAFEAGAVGLAIHQSAYIADVFISGLRGVAREQTEVGRLLGLKYTQTYCYVLLPQLLPSVIPPLTNQYIEVIKNSPIVMLLGLPELTYYTQQIDFETGRGYLAALAVTVLYLLFAFVVSSFMALLQSSLRRHA